MASLLQLQRRPQSHRPAVPGLRFCVLSGRRCPRRSDPYGTGQSGLGLHGQRCLQPSPHPARDRDDLSVDRAGCEWSLRQLPDPLTWEHGTWPSQAECRGVLADSTSWPDADHQLFPHRRCPVRLDRLSPIEHHHPCNRPDHLDPECSSAGGSSIFGGINFIATILKLQAPWLETDATGCIAGPCSAPHPGVLSRRSWKEPWCC